MSTEMIDHATLTQLVELGSVKAAHVIGQAGGWGVVIRYGRTQSQLAASRSRQARLFKRLETLVAYLKDLGISSFDVDAANYNLATAKTYSRPDRAKALKQAHQAAAHDKWFREQVEIGLAEADDLNTEWVAHEAVKEDMAKQRTALRARIKRTAK